MLVHRASERPALQALPATGDTDYDGDGLTDLQESILGTSPVEVDSDGDGFWDGEELARQSPLLLSNAMPARGRLGTGLTARRKDGTLVLTAAVYVPDLNVRTKEFSVGILRGHRLLTIDPSFVMTYASFRVVPAVDPQSYVAVIEIPLNEAWVMGPQPVSMFVTVEHTSTSYVAAAAVARFLNIDGVPFLASADPTELPSNFSSGSGATPSTRRGSILVPLLDSEDPPPTWMAGQICSQRAAPVGSNGSLVTSEVTRADCSDSWDAWCPSSCSSSVGETFTTIDPLGLIGG